MVKGITKKYPTLNRKTGKVTKRSYSKTHSKISMSSKRGTRRSNKRG